MKRVFVLFAVLLIAGCATKPATTYESVPVPTTKQPTVAKKKAQAPAAPAAAAQPPGGAIEWDPNPAVEEISEYRVYRLQGNAPPKLEGTTTTTTFRPAKKGTFYVTALNPTGESPPSEEIKL